MNIPIARFAVKEGSQALDGLHIDPCHVAAPQGAHHGVRITGCNTPRPTAITWCVSGSTAAAARRTAAGAIWYTAGALGGPHAQRARPTPMGRARSGSGMGAMCRQAAGASLGRSHDQQGSTRAAHRRCGAFRSQRSGTGVNEQARPTPRRAQRPHPKRSSAEMWRQAATGLHELRGIAHPLNAWCARTTARWCRSPLAGGSHDPTDAHGRAACASPACQSFSPLPRRSAHALSGAGGSKAQETAGCRDDQRPLGMQAVYGHCTHPRARSPKQCRRSPLGGSTQHGAAAAMQ